MRKNWGSIVLLGMILFVSNLSFAGSIQITGEPGAGQPRFYELGKCRLLPNGQIAKYGCNHVNSVFILNSSYTLEEGTYLLTYSGSIYPQLVLVTPDSETVIRLKRLRISNGSRVFVDLTSDLEQRLFLQSIWANGENRPAPGSQFDCDTGMRRNSTYCTAWSGISFESLRENFITFDSTGRWNYAGLAGVSNPSTRNGINILEGPGNFVSVFPGVYINQSISGREEYGVQVN